MDSMKLKKILKLNRIDINVLYIEDMDIYIAADRFISKNESIGVDFNEVRGKDICSMIQDIPLEGFENKDNILSLLLRCEKINMKFSANNKYTFLIS